MYFDYIFKNEDKHQHTAELGFEENRTSPKLLPSNTSIFI